MSKTGTNDDAHRSVVVHGPWLRTCIVPSIAFMASVIFAIKALFMNEGFVLLSNQCALGEYGRFSANLICDI